MTSSLSVSSATPLYNLADEYLVLLETQQTIGVDSLLFGFFSTDWVRLQDRYLRAVGLPQLKHEALRAIRSIITAFHDQCHVVWLLRNAHLHGTDPNNTTSHKHLHLLAQIRALYEAAAPHMMVHDRDVLAVPLEARQFQSTTALKTFYSHAKPIVEQSLEDAAKLGSQFRLIDTYFHPVIPPELFNVIL
jgi:hypothetical protein